VKVILFYTRRVNHEDVRLRFRCLSAFLDERMRRLVAAAESEAMGYGGVSAVARATGVSRRAITEGRSCASKRCGVSLRRRSPGFGGKVRDGSDPSTRIPPCARI
jgi:hypothetical protein